MRFVIYSQDQRTRSQLLRLVRLWMALTCAELEIVVWSQLPADLASERRGIFLLDTDGMDHPEALLPLGDRSPKTAETALFICTSCPKTAINCYAIHPTGLLQKPLEMEALWRALDRCVSLWWGNLRRVELLSDWLSVQLPLYDILWAESVPKGCLLHRSKSQVLVRQPLSALEEMLPGSIFLRCQRSFLINLCHVREIQSKELLLSDGTALPFGRKLRGALTEAYETVCSMRAGNLQGADEHEKHLCCDL